VERVDDDRRPGAAGEESVPWGGRASLLARKIAAAAAAGEHELVLDDTDLAAMDATTLAPVKPECVKPRYMASCAARGPGASWARARPSR